MKTKIVYNNYQFYESKAFINYIEGQEEKGYVLENTLGNFLKILIFKKERW